MVELRGRSPGSPASSRSAPLRRHKFVALDGLRGVAAVLVLAYHAPDHRMEHLLPGGYLAVDLFFVLSGFVIAHAYQARLDAGLGWREFMVARLIRLYPLYLLGTLIAITLVVGHRLIHRSDPIGLPSVVAALLFLPTPERIAPYSLYPLDFPAWSLFFELLANAVFAAVARHLTDRRLMVAIGLAAVGLIVSAAAYGSLDAGYEWTSFGAGLGRVGYTFLAGVAVERLWRRGRWRVIALPPLAGAVIVIALLAMPAGPWRNAFDVVAALIVMPLLILASARREPDGRLATLFAGAGAMSYAIYALHAPLRNWLVSAAPYIVGRDYKQLGAAGTLFFLGLVIAFAVAADRLYDTPVRRWLTRRGLKEQCEILGAQQS